MRIAIVDDYALVAIALKLNLEEDGHEVVGTARNGEAALALAERTRPDLLVCDVGLGGGMDGVEVAEAAFARWGIRTLFLTGAEPGEGAGRFRPEFTLGVLTKGADMVGMAAEISAACARVAPP